MLFVQLLLLGTLLLRRNTALHRNIYIYKGNTRIDFGSTYILTSMDLGTHPIERQTVPIASGYSYVSSKINPREIVLEGYIHVPHVRSGSSVPSILPVVREYKEVLNRVCTVNSPFVFCAGSSEHECYMSESVYFFDENDNGNESLCRFRLSFITSWDKYRGIVFFDPTERAWFFRDYDDIGVPKSTHLFARPLHCDYIYPFDSMADDPWSGYYGIEVYPFGPTGTECTSVNYRQMSLANYLYRRKSAYSITYATQMEFIEFSDFNPEPGTVPYYETDVNPFLGITKTYTARLSVPDIADLRYYNDVQYNLTDGITIEPDGSRISQVTTSDISQKFTITSPTTGSTHKYALLARPPYKWSTDQWNGFGPVIVSDAVSITNFKLDVLI